LFWKELGFGKGISTDGLLKQNEVNGLGVERVDSVPSRRPNGLNLFSVLLFSISDDVFPTTLFVSAADPLTPEHCFRTPVRYTFPSLPKLVGPIVYDLQSFSILSFKR
jgi:hypothetical protein